MINYLYANATELIILGLAFCMSKEKILPAFLVCYVSVMVITFGINQEYLEWLYSTRPIADMYNGKASFIYFYESFIMAVMAVIARFNLSKLGGITLIVIFAQLSVSLVMAISHRALVDLNLYVGDWVVKVHYFSQFLFVILYCVIAWMCVYYSRKT